MDKLRDACRKVVEGFELGIFCRSTAGDADPQWALRLVPYLSALAVLQREIEEPPPEERERGAGAAEDFAYDAARERGLGSVRGPD